MARRKMLAMALALAAGVLMTAQGCLWAGAAAPQPKPEPPKPKVEAKTPEEQAAQDLLDRLARDTAIQETQRRFLAEQHFKTGKTHFELQDWERARRHFEKAIALNPQHREAQEHLRKSRSLLGLERGQFGGIMDDYARIRAVGVQARKVELLNAFAEARSLYERGRFRDAIDAFTRVKALADYLAPMLEVGKTAEESAAFQQKAQEALEQKRLRDQKERMGKAIRESRLRREQREQMMSARNAGRLEQARSLFEQRRYGQARALCDAILRDNPNLGAADDLRGKAVAAGQNAVIDRAVLARKLETERHWRTTEGWTTPQAQLVSMPREIFEQVRRRKVEAVLGGGTTEAEPWEKAIREKLASQKISFDFVETPLPDVLSFLSSLTDVTIVLDQEALKDDMPAVTLRVNDMSLERAMNWVCKLVGLKYALRNEAVFVSHPKQLYDRTVLRMYDVSDLTVEITNFAGRQQALATGSGRGGEQGGDSGIGDDFFKKEDEEEEKALTGEELIKFIRSMIAPGTWREDGEGGHGVIEDPFSMIGDEELRGKQLVDVIGFAVGGRQWVGIRTRE